MTQPTPTRPSAPAASALLRGLRQRRRYMDQRVPDEVLTDILEVARWTGSAKNTQPWDLVVVRDRTTLQDLSTAGPFAGFLGGVDLAIVVAMHPGATPYDEGRLSERVMLLADAHGLGSGTGWFDDGGSARLKEKLGIPADRTVRSAIGLGYADTSVPDRPGVALGRRPLDDVVSYERFGVRQP